MKATLKFPERIQAEQFAISWGRHTKKGHTLGSGLVNVKVTVFNVSEDDKEWIDEYVQSINKSNN